MRRLPAWVVVAGALVAGCSSSPLPVDAGVDAASGPQPVGAACDPSIAAPCVPTVDPCLGVYCDPVALVCAEYVTDAGPPCSSGAAPCTTTADCDLGLACGFAVTGGCSAQGTCLNALLVCETDAASCAVGPPVCGCDGLPVPLVTVGYASAPVSGAASCPDAGSALDGGADSASGEAGT